jgi:hypothetical protein
MVKFCCCWRKESHLEDRVIPQRPLGFAVVEDLELAWELIVGRILSSHNPPTPFLFACASAKCHGAYLMSVFLFLTQNN